MLLNGDSRIGRKRSSLVRFSFMNRAKESASCGAMRAISVRCVDPSSGAKLQPVLRIQPSHRDIAPEIAADGLEDLFEHSRIKKEGRTGIESKSVRFNRRAATTNTFGAFE